MPLCLRSLHSFPTRRSSDLLISDPNQIDRLLTELSAEFTNLAEKFWPGPLTIVGKAKTNLPEGITAGTGTVRSEEHTSELQSPCNLVCRLLLQKKNNVGHAP